MVLLFQPAGELSGFVSVRLLLCRNASSPLSVAKRTKKKIKRIYRNKEKACVKGGLCFHEMGSCLWKRRAASGEDADAIITPR